MDVLATVASRLRRFGAQMKPDVPHIDEALPSLRAMLSEAGVAYKLVGGIAVIHHGYERLTVDLDVLVTPDGVSALDGYLEAHGFVRVAPNRLSHSLSGVRVDLLVETRIMAGPRGEVVLPSPEVLEASTTAPDVVSLPGLISLKLAVGRRQDVADVLHLLKRLDDSEYLAVEAAVPPSCRREVAELREEALEELAWEQD